MLFLGSPTELILAPATLQSVRYEGEDFRNLGIISRPPLALHVRGSLPFGNDDELVAWSKSNPDKPLTYGSVGVGSIFHLAGEALAEASGASLIHVPYRGGAPLLQALAGLPLMPAMSMAQAAQFYEAEIKVYRQAVAKAKLQPS